MLRFIGRGSAFLFANGSELVLLDRLCKWTDTFKTLDMNVYLMHLDDEQAISAFAEKTACSVYLRYHA
ncbi:MAG: hypothetical protein ILA24_07105 [Ruminococcus sp.]|nr:hypothetical protein [Ruminococcus sp.]